MRTPGLSVSVSHGNLKSGHRDKGRCKGLRFQVVLALGRGCRLGVVTHVRWNVAGRDKEENGADLQGEAKMTDILVPGRYRHR